MTHVSRWWPKHTWRPCIGTGAACQYARWNSELPTLSHSSTDRLLSDPELSAAESPLADKKAPGSERAAERAAAQQNSERARLASQPPYVHMQVMQALW